MIGTFSLIIDDYKTLILLSDSLVVLLSNTPKENL